MNIRIRPKLAIKELRPKHDEEELRSLPIGTILKLISGDSEDRYMILLKIDDKPGKGNGNRMRVLSLYGFQTMKKVGEELSLNVSSGDHYFHVMG